MAAVLADQGRKEKIVDSTVEMSDVDLFGKHGYSTVKDLLAVVLRKVSLWIGRRYVPVRLAIPDPALYTYAMHFESFPRGSSRQHQLVQWQLEKAFHVQNDTLSVAFAKNTRTGRGTDIFASGVRKQLLHSITNAFSGAAIDPEAVKGAAFYRAIGQDLKGSSVNVHIILVPEYVSVVFWGASGVPYTIRSFWRMGTDYGLEEELQDIARDVERTLHAFSVRNPDKRIGRLCLFVENEAEQQQIKQFFHINEKVRFDDMAFDNRLQLSANEHFLSSAIDAALQ